MKQPYSFAHLTKDAVRELQQLESRLNAEFGEDITLIAYTKKDEDDARCRADAKGD